MIDATNRGACAALRDDEPERVFLESFCVFALSRMYRWEAVDLEPGSPGLDLVQRHAALTLSEDSFYALHGKTATPADLDARLLAKSHARVGKWFADRPRLKQAEAAYLDLVLFEVDQGARRRLAGTMEEPPMKDTIGQILLMRRAMALLPELWASVRLTTDSPAVAIAVGIDVHSDDMPGICVEPVVAKFPGFAPQRGLPPIRYMPEHWLSKSSRPAKPGKEQ